MTSKSHIYYGRIALSLAILLALQLTGFMCWSELQRGISGENSAEYGITVQQQLSAFEGTHDGCPCHMMFHTVSLPLVVVSPLFWMLREAPYHSMLTFVPSLFHPPILT